MAFLLLASLAAADSCVTNLDVAGYYEHLDNFDLILDVRNSHEYTGNGDELCNTGSDPEKCNYGHQKNMYFMENPAREDGAAVYRDHLVRVWAPDLVAQLKECFGDKVAHAKIAVSCHSGSRSGVYQQGLVEAGFTCANIYNVVPGAKGLHAAWVEAGKGADSTHAFVKGTDAMGSFDFSTCEALRATVDATVDDDHDHDHDHDHDDEKDSESSAVTGALVLPFILQFLY